MATLTPCIYLGPARLMTGAVLTPAHKDCKRGSAMICDLLSIIFVVIVCVHTEGIMPMVCIPQFGMHYILTQVLCVCSW